MAYLFNLKSKPGLKYEKEEEDGIVDMIDFFNTGENDDAICSYALEFDDDTGVVSFEGEWDKENDEELDGSRPDIFDVEERIKAFAEFFDVEWEEDSKIIDNGDGDDYEITF